MCAICKKNADELKKLRAFKRKYDQDIKKLIGGVIWKDLHGKITIGCVPHILNKGKT